MSGDRDGVYAVVQGVLIASHDAARLRRYDEIKDRLHETVMAVKGDQWKRVFALLPPDAYKGVEREYAHYVTPYASAVSVRVVYRIIRLLCRPREAALADAVARASGDEQINMAFKLYELDNDMRNMQCIDEGDALAVLYQCLFTDIDSVRITTNFPISVHDADSVCAYVADCYYTDVNRLRMNKVGPREYHQLYRSLASMIVHARARFGDVVTGIATLINSRFDASI